MNKLKKAVKVLALALGIGAAWHAMAADIAEIRPCSEDGTAISYTRSKAQPYENGEDFYFILRLCNPAAGKPWGLKHVGSNDPAVDAAYLPEIGIYVSGELRRAKMHSLPVAVGDSATARFTDIVFSYKVMPGDFANPASLAVKTSTGDVIPGSTAKVSDGVSLVVYGTERWQIAYTNDDSEDVQADLAFRTDLGALTPLLPDTEIATPLQRLSFNDTTIPANGFYVKSVDFNTDWAEAPTETSEGVWREVHQKTSRMDIKSGSGPVQLVAMPEAVIGTNRTFYVWSDREDLVKVYGTTAAKTRSVDIALGSATVKTTVQVATVVVEANATPSATGLFEIRGIQESDEIAHLYMSPWADGYKYDANGEKMTEDVISVPVKCIYAKPPTLAVTSTTDSLYASGNYTTPAATLYVSIDQTYSDDITVQLQAPVFTDASVTDWSSYLRFSKKSGVLPTDDTLPSVTIAAGSLTAEDPIYVYALKSDEHTIGADKTITLSVAITEPTAATATFNPDDNEEAVVNILTIEGSTAGSESTTATPLLKSWTGSASTSPFRVTNGEENAKSFTIAVSDTYAAETDRTTGYKIYYRYTSSDDYVEPEEGAVYGVGKNGVLYKLDTATNTLTSELPKFWYPSASDDLYESDFYVVSPFSGNESARGTFYAKVEAAGTVTITSDNGENTFNEGDAMDFTITLSKENIEGQVIYAFLKENLGAKAAMFDADFVICDDTDITTTYGIPIGKNQTSSSDSLQFLEGTKGKGMKVQFEVVLCKTPEYDPNQVVNGYASQYLNLRITNVEPQVKRIEMDGFESEYDTYTFPNQYPRGETEHVFKAFVTDAGEYDLSNGFKIKWTYYLNGQIQGTWEPTGDIGNPYTDENAWFKLPFTMAGTYTVKLQYRDKDMDDWSTTTYSVNAVAIDSPVISVVAPSILEESVSNPGIVAVSLGYWDPGRGTNPLHVRVTVSNSRTTETTFKGCLRLEASSAVTETQDTTDPYTYYYDFTVNSANTFNLNIDPDTLDGARNARFTVKAEVLDDDVLPTSGTAAKNYYAPFSVPVQIVNMAPTCRVAPGENESTNRWTTARTITWWIDDDVSADVSKGFTVKWDGCDNATSETVYELTQGQFTPVFNTPGDIDLLLTITDADGGAQYYEWHFTIPSAKTVLTTAVGPSGGTLGLSTKYAKAKGIGEGHIWTPGVYNGAEDFSLNWNGGNVHELALYGWGYKVGTSDNGALDRRGNARRDYALDIYGYGSKDKADLATGAYAYGDTVKDSFLYTFIARSASDAGSGEIALVGATIWPEGGATQTPYIDLPTSMGEDGVYSRTLVDAIFSKEWRELDNCGDINQDSIPDRFLLTYEFGVSFDGASDLSTVRGFNNDNDFLPKNDHSGLGFNPGISGGWGAAGGPFHANYEIRGFGPGLNAGYKVGDTDPAPDYTPYEMAAYMEWKGCYTTDELKAMSTAEIQQAFAGTYTASDETVVDITTAATADLALYNSTYGTQGWSPERPTDPTVADTDEDGLPDGYEYWIWYGARVGYPDKAGGNWNGRLTGKRLNLSDLENPDDITSEAIAAAFDPQAGAGEDSTGAAQNFISRDFDNDGISDYEEFLIGSNPFNCDTDGDGMSDGWEIMHGLNPLAHPNSEENPDNDYMAYARSMIKYNGTYVAEGAAIIEIPQTVGDTTVNTIYMTTDYAAVLYADETLDPDGYFPILPVGKTEVERPARIKAAKLGTGNYADLVWTINGQKIPKTPYNMDEDNNSLAQVEIELPDAENAKIYYDPDIRLIHEQVYWFFGFDPRTAVSIAGNGTSRYVTQRWDVTDPISAAGLHIHTKAYTSKDEYLLYKYARGANLRAAQPHNTVLLQLYDGTTSPNVEFSDKTYGDSTHSYSGAQHGADTDADGVPDGWELYTDFNPSLKFTSKNPLEARWDTVENTKKFQDGLDLAGEYAGSDSSYAYQGVESIYSHHPGVQKGWWNKFFPTDPRDPDTDGDEIVDGEEGDDTFIYGSVTDDHKSFVFRGGGANPCTVDTDSDGIPDGWEKQYAGVRVNADGTKYGTNDDSDETFNYPMELKIADGFPDGNVAAKGPYIMGGMDASDPADSCTVISTKHVATDTIRDFDFDRDGLENFQEYLTQAVRHWRYDDTETPLMGRAIVWGETAADAHLSDPASLSYIEHDYENGEDMLSSFTVTTLGSAVTPESLYFQGSTAELKDIAGNPIPDITNPQPVLDPETGEPVLDPETGDPLITYPNKVSTDYGVLAAGEFDYKAIGYLAPCDHDWDPWCKQGLASTGGNRFMRYPSTMALYVPGVGPKRIKASRYVSTSPISSDTDADGMDDYWEIYHGLNPIYGGAAGSDTISSSYKKGSLFSAVNNVWSGYILATLESIEEMETMDETSEPGKINIVIPAAGTTYEQLLKDGIDLIRFPWLAGGSQVDADGDGIRNFNESITGNMTSPTTYHTDPSPLWMTDSSSPMSYVSQYYNFGTEIKTYSFFAERYAKSKVNPNVNGTLDAATYAYLFPFEEVEGYDTDGDFRGDGHELVKAVLPTSDPLDATDPSRRTALYFTGNEADNSPSLAVSYENRLATYGNYHAIEDGEDVFRQFTVELWVKPEEFGADRTLIERGSEYPASSLVNSNGQWRANFRIGIDPNGYAYGLFDADDAIPSGVENGFATQKVVGPILELDTWTHLALAYDGTTLRLYVDGAEYSSASSTAKLIPANGVMAIKQDPSSTNYPFAGYTVAPTMTILGGRRAGTDFIWAHGFGDLIPPEVCFSQFTNFFKGYLSEVRVWDGARSASQIAQNYKKRFMVEDVEENRLEVYGQWKDGATRNDQDGDATLSPQLMMHYNFSQLPAAYDAPLVATEPSGFANGVLENCQAEDSSGAMVVPEGAKVGWWSSTPMKSTVYTSDYVIPWIKNTVSHLAPFDGGTSDSMYWNQHFAGYNPASMHDVTTYAFPNSGNPYAGSRYGVESLFRWWRLEHQNDAAATEYANRRHFENRSSFMYSTDLVPLGSAYAKYDADFWDDQGVSTAWTDTSTDEDGDDLPDWWENFVSAGGDSGVTYSDLPDDLAPTATLRRNGVLMTLAEAYMRDLAKGYVLTAEDTVEQLDDYVDKRDFDANGLPDWWVDLYGVTGGPADDDDNDGLSNYMEYLLSEIFIFNDDGADGDRVRIAFSPVDAYSVDMQKYGIRRNIDYFYKVGDLYVGEIFSDHDFIEDVWEDNYPAAYSSRYKWNGAQTDDGDGDGWSLFAEARYNQFTSSIFADLVSHTTVGYEKKDMPRPVIELDIAYNGNLRLNETSSETSTSTSGSSSSTTNTTETTTIVDANSWVPVIVQTYSRKGQEVYDSRFYIKPGEDIEGEVQLGQWAHRTIRGTLTPGYITYSTLELQSMQVSTVENYTWYVYTDSYVGSGDVRGTGDGFVLCQGSYQQFYSDYLVYGRANVSETGVDYAWGRVSGFSLKNDESGKVAYICIDGIQYGSVNLITGEFEFDMGKIGDYWAGFISEATGVPVTVQNSAFRFVYTSHIPVLQNKRLRVFLGEPQNAGNRGYVREGINRIEAWFDCNGDGYYTEGEPYGVVDGVEVGWRRGKAEMELTDFGATTRVNVFNDTSDSLDTVDNAIVHVIKPTENMIDNVIERNVQDNVKTFENSTSTRRIRVVRYAVNGWPIYQAQAAARTILDKTFSSLTRPVLTEADLMSWDDLDVDWEYFASEVANKATVLSLVNDVTNITYLVVTGDGITGFDSQTDTNTVYALNSTIVRKFDRTRQRPVLYAPGAVESEVFGSRPEFKWTMENDTYTAFRVQVATDKAFSAANVVWDSGVRRAGAPALKNDNLYHYAFSPDLYAGDILAEEQNYYWRVSMYNAKFRGSDLWSTNYPAFRMDAVADNYKYGSIKVAAKYFGPARVFDEGVLRVEAYETPDFTGTPVARTFVSAADAASVTAEGEAHTLNATLVGLPAGTYYVRGYIDLDDYGTAYKKDACESWGYVSPRDGTTPDMFMPTAITIGTAVGAGTLYTLYIEDVDTNGNSLPDAWEVVKNGGALDEGTVRIEDEGVLTISDDVLEALETTNESVQGLAAYTMSIMKNAGIAALATSANIADRSEKYSIAVVNSQSELTNEVSASTPVIKAITTDDGKVVITATTRAKVDVVAVDGSNIPVASANWHGAGSAPVPDEATITGRIVYTTDLSTPLDDWNESGILVTATVVDGQVVTEEFDVSSLCQGEEQCFFRVKFE